MGAIKLLSWNVNGLRAMHKKGFLEWLLQNGPDILCVQETKASEDQIPEDVRNVERYHTYWSSSDRGGYSGVGLWTKEKPRNVQTGFGIEAFDGEGRILIADYGSFVLCNIYFPNGKASKERLAYKLQFYDAFLNYADNLKAKGRELIICGDVNTAHTEVDLARPRANEKVSGFLPEERAWIDTFIAHGYIDTFRMFNDEGGHYSWWDLKSRARERNVGWRIDYFFVSENLRNRVQAAFILPEVMGSDHCPVGIEIDLEGH